MTISAPRAARWRVAFTILFAFVAAVAIVLRIPSIAEPLGIDQSLWASAVRGLARGQRLYRDVWEQRPPGIYWTYLAGFRVFGWHAATVAWLDIVASAATTILLYRIGRDLSGALTGALAAALFAALTMPAWLYGHDGFLERSVCETFICAAIALAAWCAVRVRENGSRAAAVVLGVAAGAAVVLKPNAGAYFPALLLWLAISRRSADVRLVRVSALAIAGAAVIPVLAFVWLWQLGLLHDARVAVVDFNRYYVSERFAPAAYAIELSKAIWLRIKTEPLWTAGAAGAAAAIVELVRRHALAPLAALAVAWGAASALMIIVNGARLFNSYFMNPLPPLALLGAWFLADWTVERRAHRWVASAVAAAMLALLIVRGYAPRVLGWARLDVSALRGRIDRNAYLEQFGGYGNEGGYSARANAELADYVHAHTSYDDRIFLFGISGAGVYFLSDRLVAQRFLRVNDFVDSTFWDPQFRLEAVVRELARAAPKYLIFERLPLTSHMATVVNALPGSPALQPLLAHYQLETRIEDFTLYARR